MGISRVKVTCTVPPDVPARSLLGAIDQGTSSSRFMVFDPSDSCRVISSAQCEFDQIYPPGGDASWHEHDIVDIWGSVSACIAATAAAFEENGIDLSSSLRCLGITNQRETTCAWDATTGAALGHAIVWDDGRTAGIAASLSTGELGADRFREATGLPLAGYFAGTKIRWLVEYRAEVGAALRGEGRGAVRIGTVDAYLVWRLTAGRVFATDATNASRTLLSSLASPHGWDAGRVALFSDGLLDADVHLPRICASVDPAAYGAVSLPACLAGVPITAVLGDQQAALFGQCAFDAGEAKCTYGTGMFLMLSTGTRPVPSTHGLLSTVAYSRAGADGAPPTTHYALEGSVSHCGSVVQWLRDRLEIIDSAAQSTEYAASLDDNAGLYFVPAFGGLFAPHWRSDARGCIVGMGAAHTKRHVCRAALEAPAYQARELFDAMAMDSGRKLEALRVDGGMAASDFTMQFQAEMLDVEVIRPRVAETTAAGAAYAAGLAVGVWDTPEDIRAMWAADKTWTRTIDDNTREKYWRGWKKAISKSLDWVEKED